MDDIYLDKEIKKDFIITSIEISFLFDLGIDNVEKIGKRLREKYRCEFSDCYEKPEYLKKILVEIFGNNSNNIIELMKKNLKYPSDQKKDIVLFLESLQQ